MTASRLVAATLDARTIPASFRAMRPLKPYLLALGGFVAAVFSAVFPGAQPGARIPTPATAPQPDLQASRSAPVAALSAGAEARIDRRDPAPQPEFPASDRPRPEAFRAGPLWSQLLTRGLRARVRLIDQRQLLLVGVIELRI